MSELKGQLFGIIMVVTVFGAMAAALAPVFSNYISDATDQIEVTVDAATTNYVQLF